MGKHMSNQPIERKSTDPSLTRTTRRGFVRLSLGAVLGAGLLGVVVRAADGSRKLWQLDPNKCVQCGRCATACVLEPSAVKCVHDFKMCGYCELCTGYFEPDPHALNSGAENQLCPLGAIERRLVESPYYEYRIDRDLCIGCAKCVRGCTAFGNGSMYLQVLHDRCVNCNRCAIAECCPSGAFRQVPADQPYIFKEGH